MHSWGVLSNNWFNDDGNQYLIKTIINYGYKMEPYLGAQTFPGFSAVSIQTSYISILSTHCTASPKYFKEEILKILYNFDNSLFLFVATLYKMHDKCIHIQNCMTSAYIYKIAWQVHTYTKLSGFNKQSSNIQVSHAVDISIGLPTSV